MKRLLMPIALLILFSCVNDSKKTELPVEINEVKVNSIFKHSGKDRIYNYYIPKNFNKNSPAIFVFHAWGGTSLGTMNFMNDVHNFHELADKFGYLLVYPEGLPNEVDHLLYNTNPKDNGNWWCTDPSGEICSNDDVGFSKELAKYFIKKYDLDASKIYATGYSNGGVATWAVNQKANEIFKGAAAFGAINTSSMGIGFPSKNAFPILMFDGLLDPFALQEGTNKPPAVMKKIWLPEHANTAILPYTRKQVFEYYANLSNCLQPEIIKINNINTLTKYSNCDNNIQLWRYEVQDYGHLVPALIPPSDKKQFSNRAGIDMGEVIFDFFTELN